MPSLGLATREHREYNGGEWARVGRSISIGSEGPTSHLVVMAAATFGRALSQNGNGQGRITPSLRHCCSHTQNPAVPVVGFVVVVRRRRVVVVVVACRPSSVASALHRSSTSSHVGVARRRRSTSSCVGLALLGCRSAWSASSASSLVVVGRCRRPALVVVGASAPTPQKKTKNSKTRRLGDKIMHHFPRTCKYQLE